MMRRWASQKGITLLELVVSLAILGIVLAVGYSFFGFGADSHSRGEQKAIAHQNVRLVVHYIDRQLRYATLVEVLEDADGIPEPEDIDADSRENYLFIDEQHRIIHRDHEGDRTLPSPALAEGTAFSLEFESRGVEKAEGKVLYYRVGDAATGYSIESQVHPENLGVSTIETPSGGNTGIAIRYRQPSLMGTPNNPLDVDEEQYDLDSGCC